MKKTIIYIARSILTMNPDQPRATAVAVRDGRVLSVGGLEDIIHWLKRSPFLPYEVETLFADKILLPGLVDAHTHLASLALEYAHTFVAQAPWPRPGTRIPRRPCNKNSPRGTASGGVFTGRGVPSPGENSLETGGSSVGMGGWGDSAEEAAVGGAPAAAVAGITVLGPVCLVYAFLPCSPKFANTACRLPFGSTIFQTFAWCFSAQRFCGDLTGISQKHNQFACILGKA